MGKIVGKVGVAAGNLISCLELAPAENFLHLFQCPDIGIKHLNLTIDPLDGSLGASRYRAPYGANE